MAIIVELPSDVEQRLRAQTSNFEAEAKEAMLVGLFHQDRISHHELALALGVDRFDTDGLLKKHKLIEDLPTIQEMEEELSAFRKRLELTNVADAALARDAARGP